MQHETYAYIISHTSIHITFTIAYNNIISTCLSVCLSVSQSLFLTLRISQFFASLVFYTNPQRHTRARTGVDVFTFLESGWFNNSSRDNICQYSRPLERSVLRREREGGGSMGLRRVGWGVRELGILLG